MYSRSWPKEDLKLKPNKCEFFKTRLAYLGHIVSKDGIETDPKKIEAIRDWPRPHTVTDVRSLLGFTNHYQSTPVLAYADYSKPFKLHTDASGLGLGAVLYQTHEDGKDRVIAYASRVLSHTEAKYPAHKLECLTLKWAVTDRFHEYLCGGKFEVYTDNNPLTYILTTAKLDATGQQWVASLANDDFKLFYKSGWTNTEADALSRIPWNTELDRDSIKTIILAKSSQWSPLYETWGSNLTQLHERDMLTVKQAQISPNNLPEPKGLKKKKLSKRKWTAKDTDDLRTMLRHRHNFVLRNKLLYKKEKSSSENVVTMQFVLPKRFQLKALRACHADCGHLGIEKCESLLRERF